MQLNVLDLFSTKDLVSIMTDSKWFKHSYKDLGKEHVQFSNNKNNNNDNNNSGNNNNSDVNNNSTNNNNGNYNNDDNNNNNDNNNSGNNNNNDNKSTNNNNDNNNGNKKNNNDNNNSANNNNDNNNNNAQTLEIDITEQRQKQEDHGLHVATKFTVNLAKHMVKTENFTLTKEHLFQIHSRVLGNVFKNYAGKYRTILLWYKGKWSFLVICVSSYSTRHEPGGTHFGEKIWKIFFCILSRRGTEIVLNHLDKLIFVALVIFSKIFRYLI